MVHKPSMLSSQPLQFLCDARHMVVCSPGSVTSGAYFSKGFVLSVHWDLLSQVVSRLTVESCRLTFPSGLMISSLTPRSPADAGREGHAEEQLGRSPRPSGQLSPSLRLECNSQTLC